MINIKLSSDPLEIQTSIHWVQSPQSGGINIFIGSVREFTAGKRVISLEFEAYEKMAIQEMHKIAEQVQHKWSVNKILLHHRTGRLSVGQIPVLIAVSASHRDEAFEACRYIIDTLKQTVPIWKKEIYEDGEMWVSAHP